MDSSGLSETAGFAKVDEGMSEWSERSERNERMDSSGLSKSEGFAMFDESFDWSERSEQKERDSSGFEPRPDVLAHCVHCARLVSFKSPVRFTRPLAVARGLTVSENLRFSG